MLLSKEILSNLFHYHGYNCDYYMETKDQYTVIKYNSKYDKFTIKFRESYVYDDLIFIGAFDTIKVIKKDDLYLILEKIITGVYFNSNFYIFDTNINEIKEDVDFDYIDNNDYVIIIADNNQNFYNTGFVRPYIVYV